MFERNDRAVNAPLGQPDEIVGRGPEHADTLDHSGRIGDRVLLAALDWHPGDQHDMHAMPYGAIAHRSPTGTFHIDARHNLFVPAAIRDFLAIKCGDRLVLVASPRTGVLVVHPMMLVSALLDRFYRTLPDFFDAQ